MRLVEPDWALSCSEASSVLKVHVITSVGSDLSPFGVAGHQGCPPTTSPYGRV